MTGKMGFHGLLRRQLRNVWGNAEPPSEILPFLHLVDEAYGQADRDRLLAERALDLTSQELLDRNRRLRAFFDSAPVIMGIVEIELGSLHFVAHNAAAVLAFGLKSGMSRDRKSTRLNSSH